MRELKHVRVLTEGAGQFQLTLPKRKVQQMFKPAEDDRYYVKVDFEDDCIKVVPLEVVAEESDLQDAIEEFKERFIVGEGDADET